MADFVAYRAQTGDLMRARVVTRHRDGGATVEPWFWLDAKGCDAGPFQGGSKVRLSDTEVLPVPECAA